MAILQRPSILQEIRWGADRPTQLSSKCHASSVDTELAEIRVSQGYKILGWRGACQV